MEDFWTDKCTKCCGVYVEWDDDLILRCSECGEEVNESDLVPDHELWRCDECGKWCGFADGYEVLIKDEPKDLCHSCISRLAEEVSEGESLRIPA